MENEYNYATEENGMKILSSSSEADKCPAKNIIIPETKVNIQNNNKNRKYGYHQKEYLNQ